MMLIKKQSELSLSCGRRVTQEGVAPTVERWTPNPTVAGSNPVALTFLYNPHNRFQVFSIAFLLWSLSKFFDGVNFLNEDVEMRTALCKVLPFGRKV